MYSNKGLTKKQIEVRNACLTDFYTFVRTVAPYLQLGHCHEDMCSFMQSEGTHKLVIYPRGHLKSKILALEGSWEIVKDPSVTIITASATADLAEDQLFDMKRIIESPIISKLFPELLGNTTKGKRQKWTDKEIKVEHPLRLQRGVRDSTVIAVGAGKNITGKHCDILLLDDIIAPETDVDPFTVTGRLKAARWMSLAASILNPGGRIIGVGTRYHEKDLYGQLKGLYEPVLDENGNVIEEIPLYKTIERVVEISGDYLWPRKKALDGRYYGFDDKELAKKKAQYIDASQFYCQYYNDPSDPENRPVDPNNFQYYEPKNLVYLADTWFIANKPLKTYAAMDIAASMEKRADYTALAVIGVDEDGFRYILDIKRIKTDKISVMSDMIYRAYAKWKFKLFRCETNAQQGLIANQLEADLRRLNVIFKWDKKPSKGDKRLRILSILEPLYATKSLWHFRGGMCEILEDELITNRPQHDDVADALAMCMELVPMVIRKRRQRLEGNVIPINQKFGGVAR